MNVLKINKSLTLNIAALVGWVNLVAHLFVAIIVYFDLFQIEKEDGSAITGFWISLIVHWVILLGVLGVLVVLVLLELILGNFFTFLTPFISELLFRESYFVARIIFYGILIISLLSYCVYKLKKRK